MRSRRLLLWAGMGGIAALLFAIGLRAAAPLVEPRVFYFPDREPFGTPAGVIDVTFDSGDLTLHGWLYPAHPDGSPAPTVLFAHGNAGRLPDHVDLVSFLPDAGLNLFVFDYRSYGRSESGPRLLRREALLDDTEAALDALLVRPEVDPRRVAVVGHSLGGVMATNLAARRREPRAVVSVATFSSWRGVARDHAGIAGLLMVRGGLDARDAVRQLGDRPLLIVHGAEDTIVDARHAEVLQRAADGAGVAARTILVERGDHVDVLAGGVTRRQLADFLLRALR